MAHMYWALRCATEDCEHIERIAYIGDVNPHSVFTLPIAGEEQFEATCPQCDSVHTYKASSFEAIQHNSPPDDGFANWFPV